MEIKLVMIGQKFISDFFVVVGNSCNHAEKHRTVKLKCDKLKPKCVCVCVCDTLLTVFIHLITIH